MKTNNWMLFLVCATACIASAAIGTTWGYWLGNADAYNRMKLHAARQAIVELPSPKEEPGPESLIPLLPNTRR